jgi:uncharacterized protein
MLKLTHTGAVVMLALLAFAPSVNAQTTDAAFRRDIGKLLDATGASALGTQMATMMSNQVIDSMSKAQPNIPDRVIVIVKEVLSTEFARAFSAPDGLLSRIVDIYARHFTHAEVLALLKFYETPLGRKTVSVLPVVAQESSAAGQAWASANMVRIGGLVKERLQAEGLAK